MDYIREPAVSGTFYPDDPKTLEQTIQAYLRNATVGTVEGDIVGLISPHAGYMYSGQVAAYGYKALSGSHYDTVAVIAPSHRSHFLGAAVCDRGGYRTPLGVVSIDEELTRALVEVKSVVFPSFDAHRGEHSLEVQIPFLQTVLKNFSLIPLIMGSQEFDVCQALAQSLGEVARHTKKRILVVGSTDLSHYYPYKEAVALDSVVRRHLEAYDIEGLDKDLRKGSCEACGAGPMIATMLLSRMFGAVESKVLKYANSGDVSGDKSGVVGYVSCIFVRRSTQGAGRA